MIVVRIWAVQYFNQFIKRIHSKSFNSSITHLLSFSSFFQKQKSNAFNRAWSTGRPSYFNRELIGRWRYPDWFHGITSTMGDDIKGIYSTISVDCSSIDTLLASIITYHSVLRLRAVSCFFSSLSDTISDHQRAKCGKETPAVKYEYATVAAFNNIKFVLSLYIPRQGRNGWLLAIQPCARYSRSDPPSVTQCFANLTLRWPSVFGQDR